MNPEDLEIMTNKKVRGVAYEESMGEAKLMIITTGGRTFYFSSASPIELEMETEQ